MYIITTALQFCFRTHHLLWWTKKTKEGLKLNETHQLLVYTDDDNLLSKTINIIKKSRKALSDATKEVDLEVNMEKSKYTFMSHIQTTVQNHYITVVASTTFKTSRSSDIWK
jgi:hypothetical protein